MTRAVGVTVLVSIMLGVGLLRASAQQALDENCTVSVLNRTVQVGPDGTFEVPNLPTRPWFGTPVPPARVRATCRDAAGATQGGQTTLFVPRQNGTVVVGDITPGALESPPMFIEASPLSLAAVGDSGQLLVTGTFPDGSTRDLTAPSTGTNYRSLQPQIVTVGADGLVTATGVGTAMIAVVQEGIVTVTSVLVGPPPPPSD